MTHAYQGISVVFGEPVPPPGSERLRQPHLKPTPWPRQCGRARETARHDPHLTSRIPCSMVTARGGRNG